MTLFWSLLSAASTASYLVYLSGLLKRQPGLHPNTALLGSHAVGALLLVIIAAAINRPFLTPDAPPEAYVYVLASALLLMLSRELYLYAYARTDVANVSIFSPLTPLFAIVTGHMLLGESLSAGEAAGTLLIAGSIYLMFLKRGESPLAPIARITRSRPIFCAFLSTIPTAAAAAYQKKALVWFDPASLTFLLLALLAVMAYAVECRRRSPLALAGTRAHWWVISGSLMVLSQLIFCWILMVAPTPVALILQRLSVLFQVIIAYVWLGEKTDMKKRVLCSLGAFAGAALLIYQGTAQAATPACDTPRCKLARDGDYRKYFNADVPLLLRSDSPAAQHFLKEAKPKDRPIFDAFLTQLDDNNKAAGLPGRSLGRCAVVANSPNLLGRNHGPAIDAHDTVIRMNMGPTKGYETDVGSKTSFRVSYNTYHVPETRAGSMFLIYPHPRMTNKAAAPVKEEAHYWNMDFDLEKRYWNYIDIMARVMADHKGKKRKRAVYFGRSTERFAKESILVFSPEFLDYVGNNWFTDSDKPKGAPPTSGIIALVFALHACDQIDAYGFGEDQTKRYTHYFGSSKHNERRPAVAPSVLRNQNRLLAELAKKSIITVHFPIVGNE